MLLPAVAKAISLKCGVSVDKANNVLGWKAVHSLEDALSSAWNGN